MKLYVIRGLFPDFQEQTIAPISCIFAAKEEARKYLKELKRELISVMNEEQESCNHFSVTEDTFYLGNTRFIASLTINVDCDMNNTTHKKFMMNFSGFGHSCLRHEHIVCKDKHVKLRIASVTLTEEEINI